MLKHLLKTPLGRLRIIGFIEGISYLVLLFIAMPLKYWAGLPLLGWLATNCTGGGCAAWWVVCALHGPIAASNGEVQVVAVERFPGVCGLTGSAGHFLGRC